MARAGLEPGTAGLRVRRADHSATLSPKWHREWTFHYHIYLFKVKMGVYGGAGKSVFIFFVYDIPGNRLVKDKCDTKAQCNGRKLLDIAMLIWWSG